MFDMFIVLLFGKLIFTKYISETFSAGNTTKPRGYIVILGVPRIQSYLPDQVINSLGTVSKRNNIFNVYPNILPLPKAGVMADYALGLVLTEVEYPNKLS